MIVQVLGGLLLVLALRAAVLVFKNRILGWPIHLSPGTGKWWTIFVIDVVLLVLYGGTLWRMVWPYLNDDISTIGRYGTAFVAVFGVALLSRTPVVRFRRFVPEELTSVVVMVLLQSAASAFFFALILYPLHRRFF